MDGLFSALIESFKRQGALFLFLLIVIFYLYRVVEENRGRDLKRIEQLETKIDEIQDKYSEYVKTDNKLMLEVITKNNELLEQNLKKR